MISNGYHEEAAMSPVVAVTVTYGDRAGLCTQTIAAAKRQGCIATVVVSNAAGQAALESLKADWQLDPTIRFVELSENLGSAGGFAAGMAVAIREFRAGLIWLLDDDNLPEDQSLAALLSSRERAIKALSVRDVAVSSLRSANRLQIKRAAGRLAEYAYPQPGSFLYFDVRTRLRPHRGHSELAEPSDSILTIPCAPYGGLLVPSIAIAEAGFPKAELVLYEDDTEFTSRLVAYGFPLVLEPQSRVADLDLKWTDVVSGTGPQRLLNSRDGRRLFYFVRNRSAYDWVQATSQGEKWWCWVNMVVYFSYTLIQAGRFKKWDSMGHMLKAARMGKRQDLSHSPTLA